MHPFISSCHTLSWPCSPHRLRFATNSTLPMLLISLIPFAYTNALPPEFLFATKFEPPHGLQTTFRCTLQTVITTFWCFSTEFSPKSLSLFLTHTHSYSLHRTFAPKLLHTNIGHFCTTTPQLPPLLPKNRKPKIAMPYKQFKFITLIGLQMMPLNQLRPGNW